ncbi:MAG: hypothetical protein ACR2HH_16900 [Chthoniobacterales bacterium]
MRNVFSSALAVRALALGLLLGGIFGCTGNVQYRVGAAAVEHQIPAEGGHYDLGYIEFDEQGDFWDRDQLKRAVELIHHTTNPLLVVYVHGWQNNASPNTNDVPQFHHVLAKLARTPGVRNYQIVGVYMGWRGKQAYDPLLKILSFPTRKVAAARLGSSNTITEAIFRLVYEARHQPQRGRTVLIGHSFGALVLERAIEQAMTAGLLSDHPVIPADFILLVNSAAESIYTKEMRDMMVSTLNFEPKKKCYMRPGDDQCIYKDEARIVSVTSETDRATGVAFPLGAGIFNSGKLYRKYQTPDGKLVSQRQFFTTTPGHNKLLLDHQIVALQESMPATHAATAFDENLQNPQGLPPRPDDPQPTPIFATGGEEDDRGQVTPWRWWRLNYPGDPAHRSPFWVVKVPKEILNGHGDIFNENAIDMMVALFRLSNVLGKTGGSVPPVEIKAKPGTQGQQLTPAVSSNAPVPTTAVPVTTVTTGASGTKVRRTRIRRQPVLLKMTGGVSG